MLPSQERLSRSQFTDFLTNKGILVVYNKLGTLKYLSSSTKALSVVTSSKHQKKAVLRNKLRRRVYTLFGTKTLQIQGILYTAKTSYVLTYSEIKTLFNELLIKAQKSTT